MTVLEEAYADFRLYEESKEWYSTRIEFLNETLKLKGDKKFQSKFLPTYFVGNNAKFILFALNPGFSESQNKIEESWKSGSWQDYQEFARDFFLKFNNAGMKSPMYRKLSKLFAGIEGETLEDSNSIYNFYHENLTTVQLIPYHSKSFALPKQMENKIEEYISSRFQSNLEFARNQCSKLIVFNGKPLHDILLNQKVDLGPAHKINNKVNYHLFELDGLKCVLFDKYVTQAGFGVTNDDLELRVATNVKSFLND